jgi:hypothetical protein
LVGVVLHGNGLDVLGFLGIEHNSYEKAGQFGDSFGPLSSLMAALAAVGAWLAFQQSKEQAFETTFYSLLSHHNSIVNSIDILQQTRVKDDAGVSKLVTGDTFQGRDAFRRMLRILRSTVAGLKYEDELEKVSEGYRRFYFRYEDQLAHYFRTIYHIVSFVDSSNVRHKGLYIKILRAQLSNSEQILLLYNVTVGFGFGKFRFLAERHSLFHNMRLSGISGLWESKTLKPILDDLAFRQGDADPWPSVSGLRKLAASRRK